MLSQSTIAIIKSTVPVLAVHGKAITTRFYERMFAAHPELLHIFNHTNQKQGRQQTALANAVYAAAAHIDNLEAILPAVQQIAHKHRSLGIKPEHYPIVGENLLAAIKDVLGDAATDEIIQAWAEAYGVIADAFISVEEGMYQEAEQAAGGWRDFRNFVVARKEKESDVITSFYLKPQDGGILPPYLPGQYVTIKLEIPGQTYTFNRQYSLSDRPGADAYRISVKREQGDPSKPAGIVSAYLHEQVQPGDVLQVSAPAGDFVLDTVKDTPLVLLSGGVGLTPMMSMLEHVLAQQPGRQVTFIHAAKNSSTHAFREQLASLQATHDGLNSYVVYSQPTQEDQAAGRFDRAGHIDLPWLKSVLADNDADFYFCGPVPFMKTIHASLAAWGVPTERTHYEFFGPMGNLAE